MPIKSWRVVELQRKVFMASTVASDLFAGRARDESDVVELLRGNPDQVDAVREHLTHVNDRYVKRFNDLLARAQEQTDR